MDDVKFFYSASVMGYGDGRFWHKYYNFPDFERVTQTLTLKKKVGRPWAVFKIGDSVYNSIGMSNIGLHEWMKRYSGKPFTHNTVVSIFAKDYIELLNMMLCLKSLDIAGIEINISCPNIRKQYRNNQFPPWRWHKVYLKMSCDMNPEAYDLSTINGIRLNSIPLRFCGGSGKVAQKKNWNFIRKYASKYNVAGCSFQTMDDIEKLKDMGCKEIGIGSTIMTNPKLVEGL